MTTGEKIKAERIKAGMTQAQLAEKIGITGAALSRYEKMQRGLNTSILKKIATALNTTILSLLEDEPTFVPIPTADGKTAIVQATDFKRHEITPMPYTAELELTPLKSPNDFERTEPQAALDLGTSIRLRRIAAKLNKPQEQVVKELVYGLYNLLRTEEGEKDG